MWKENFHGYLTNKQKNVLLSISLNSVFPIEKSSRCFQGRPLPDPNLQLHCTQGLLCTLLQIELSLERGYYLIRKIERSSVALCIWLKGKVNS